MKESVKYIVSYDCSENAAENRVNVLASSNKIDYIVERVNKLGLKVDLISTSQTLNKCFYRGKKLILTQGNALRLFPTTPRGGAAAKTINLLVMRVFIILYIARKIHKNDIVIVYHSVGNLWILPLLRLKKAFIIEEVEEIYGYIFGKKKMANRELHALQNADAYIYPTALINKLVNIKNKPFILIHGSYKIGEYATTEEKRVEENFFEPDRIHVGYTGILDPRKGYIDFVHCAKWLDEKYHLHVIGFGSEREIVQLQQEIEKMQTNTKCILSFDGIRRGRAYEVYLQCLDVGVCPLNPNDEFTKSQFPSKVVSYLSNGLQVVCTRVEAVESSDIAEAISFYEGDQPHDMARAIMKAGAARQMIDTKELIRSCQQTFDIGLEKLIK